MNCEMKTIIMRMALHIYCYDYIFWCFQVIKARDDTKQVKKDDLEHVTAVCVEL